MNVHLLNVVWSTPLEYPQFSHAAMLKWDRSIVWLILTIFIEVRKNFFRWLQFTTAPNLEKITNKNPLVHSQMMNVVWRTDEEIDSKIYGRCYEGLETQLKSHDMPFIKAWGVLIKKTREDANYDSSPSPARSDWSLKQVSQLYAPWLLFDWKTPKILTSKAKFHGTFSKTTLRASGCPRWETRCEWAIEGAVLLP